MIIIYSNVIVSSSFNKKKQKNKKKTDARRLKIIFSNDPVSFKYFLRQSE